MMFLAVQVPAVVIEKQLYQEQADHQLESVSTFHNRARYITFRCATTAVASRINSMSHTRNIRSQ